MSGPADILVNSEMLSPVLGVLVATPAAAIMDVSMGKIHGLLPMASWVLPVVSNVEPSNCKPALPECIMLPKAGCTTGEVRPTPSAGAVTFPTLKVFLGCCPSLALGMGLVIVPESKGGLETWVPLLTNILSKHVETSVDGMLPLDGVLSELGDMDNGVWFSLETGEEWKRTAWEVGVVFIASALKAGLKFVKVRSIGVQVPAEPIRDSPVLTGALGKDVPFC